MLYLALKHKKSFSEWALLISIISLVPFIYIATYIKWLLPVFFVSFAAIGIINALNTQKKSSKSRLLIVILIITTIFTSFYQFPVNKDHQYYENYIEESNFQTGQWIKGFTEGNLISNDRIISFRIGAYSDTAHFLMPSSLIDSTYDFFDTNVSLFTRYPISSQEFWFMGYDGPDVGEDIWYRTHNLRLSPQNFGIKYVVEDIRANGYIMWNHGGVPSKLLELASNQNLIYDVGNIKIWQL
jgi:hypothetical protein